MFSIVLVNDNNPDVYMYVYMCVSTVCFASVQNLFKKTFFPSFKLLCSLFAWQQNIAKCFSMHALQFSL